MTRQELEAIFREALAIFMAHPGSAPPHEAYREAHDGLYCSCGGQVTSNAKMEELFGRFGSPIERQAIRCALEYAAALAMVEA